jgi:MFS family permease
MRPGALAVGVVALEFAAAVSRFVASTLLPVVARDLHAGGHLALLLAGSTIGLFVALPVAGRVAARLGAAGGLSAGLAGYVLGAVVSATARSPWVFAAGQFVNGVAGGLLAVFGISAVIEHLPPGVRAKVVAAASAMWIVPALVGPAATLALERAVGWRWALLLPLPIMIAGRLLVSRVAGASAPTARPLGRTWLVPAGVAVLVLAGSLDRGRPLVVAGGVVAVVGVAGLLPRGTGRLDRGVPAAMAAMTLFATGYFGADGLVTVLLTDGYHVGLGRATVVLSAAPLCWALTSLVAVRYARRGAGPAVLGLGLAAAGGAVLALAGPAFPAAVAAWAAGGVGVGIAYPCLYLLCTTGERYGALELATAVITAEAFGGLLGQSAGGVLVPAAGLVTTYLVFAVLLAAGAVAATRAVTPTRVPAARVTTAR